MMLFPPGLTVGQSAVRRERFHRHRGIPFVTSTACRSLVSHQLIPPLHSAEYFSCMPLVLMSRQATWDPEDLLVDYVENHVR
jgi:hypothetical protein